MNEPSSGDGRRRRREGLGVELTGARGMGRSGSKKGVALSNGAALPRKQRTFLWAVGGYLNYGGERLMGKNELGGHVAEIEWVCF